jgi:hypothetical protein
MEKTSPALSTAHRVFNDIKIATFMFSAPRLAHLRNFFLRVFQTAFFALIQHVIIFFHDMNHLFIASDKIAMRQ